MCPTLKTRKFPWNWLFAALWMGAAAGGASARGELKPGETDFFEKRIRPVLDEHCYECHSEAKKKTKGGLTLDTKAGVEKGGDTGALLVAGDPEKSRLIEAVRYRNQDLQMPPKKPLAPEQVRDLEQWVRMGAPDPREFSGGSGSVKRHGVSVEEGRTLWAYRAMSHPTVPGGSNGTPVSQAIDAFLNAALAAKQIPPAPPADRRILLRRVVFDLTGLPPTPEETDAFLADHAPDAFERLVERLLASPAYGERWGRHWLDVARYADSNGMDENVAFGNAWRYRDYVVASFNKDKPYDEFLREQVAGDLLPARDEAQKHERLTALGFLCIGPKLLAEADKVKLQMDLIDEQIDTLGRAFLGMTLGCARCHTHKFDPIPTEDYYALATIFKNTQTVDDYKTIAKWHEPVVATPAEKARFEQFQERVRLCKDEVEQLVADANEQLLSDTGLVQIPKDAEKQYPPETVLLLKQKREALDKLQKEAPELPSTMGVRDAASILETLPVHIRGSHLTLGKPVSRGFLQVMQPAGAPAAFPPNASGRRELAEWLTQPEHPLTARVMANRIWKWHFGQGIVASVDNFGALGEKPSNPELLDWLARYFVESGWSVKAVHRLILNSAAYQRASMPPPHSPQPTVDPENRLFGHFPPRRLEAEEIRDALLSVAGTLDRAMGGKTIPLKNREFVFNHTSKDATTYDSARRALYLPVVRNNVYDLFEQFDFPDPAVSNGSRNQTVVAPQALLMLNSELVVKSAQKFAQRVLASSADDAHRVQFAYALAYGRAAKAHEVERTLGFLAARTDPGAGDGAGARVHAWEVFCHSLLAANEFIYLN